MLRYTKVVSNQALGAYLRRLIDARPDLTIADVSDRAGVARNYLYRMSNGLTKEPSARLLYALVKAARADIGEASALLYSKHATERDGEAFALARLVFESEASTPLERQRAAWELERLANDLDASL